LVANLKKSSVFGGPTLSLQSTTGAYNYWKNKKDDAEIAYYSDGGTRREYDYRPYYRTRRLTSYYFSMFYEVAIGGNSNGYTLTISCN